MRIEIGLERKLILTITITIATQPHPFAGHVSFLPLNSVGLTVLPFKISHSRETQVAQLRRPQLITE
jgi:hypothetical protein